MLQVLLGKHGDIHLEYDILASFAERILSYDSNSSKLPQKQLQDYTYAASGSFGLIIYWIMTDCQEDPNELAIRITELTRGVRIANDSPLDANPNTITVVGMVFIQAKRHALP